jgi:hypothetical protein
MPRLACWSCGRSLYTVSPLESLFTEERRCPRCGAFLHHERRETERRGLIRRGHDTPDPSPRDDEGERRNEERRERQRRGSGVGVATGSGGR